MKVILLGLLAAVAAFDGSGSFTSDTDLAAHLAGTHNDAHASTTGTVDVTAQAAPTGGLDSADAALQAVQSQLGAGFSRAGVCAGGDVTTVEQMAKYADCVEVRGCLSIQGLPVTALVFDKLERIVEDDSVSCTGIDAGLRIDSCTQLTTLDTFAALSHVEGSISVTNCNSVSTTGLLGAGLEVVTGSVQISNNAALADVGRSWDFHNNLLPGSLTLEENTMLASIRGFSVLQQVGGGVTVCGSNELQSLAGLEQLALIGKGGLSICNNAALYDTSAIAGVINIAGALDVRDNAALQAINGFQQIMNIGANGNMTSVAIKNNGQLVSVAINATSVSGSIEIENNPNLAVLDMSGMSTIGSNAAGKSIVVLQNHHLKDLSGLRGLQGALQGAITIANNAQLLSLNGLQQVLSAGRDNSGVALAVRDNAHLATTAGLAMTGSIEGAVHIMRNPHLEVLAGLQGISEIAADETGNALVIKANTLLSNLTGFEGLTQLNGALEITSDDSLYTLDGLANLRAVNGANQITGNALTLISNHELADVDALQALVHVEGGIDIEDNKIDNVWNLLDGLDSVTSAVIHGVECLSSANRTYISQISGGDVELDEHTSFTACKHETDAFSPSLHMNKLGDAAEYGSQAATEVGALAEGRICGGRTKSGDSVWNEWDLGSVAAGMNQNGLKMTVDTTKCNFASTPRYLSSVSGQSAHWQLVGVNSVYSATPSSFTLYLWHPTLRGRYLVYFAARYRWSVNWLADTSRRSGNTVSGATGWKQVPTTTNALYADVNTLKSGYEHPTNAAPRYVTAIHGMEDHWKVQGAHAVYNPTTYGFRVFVVYPTPITPAQAETKKWRIMWTGSYDDQTSGISSNTWMSYRGTNTQTPTALQIRVDTLAGMYSVVPAYVTSISGRSHHWKVTGAGALYDATAQSFKMYLDHAQTPAFAKEHDWRVNYIAYANPINCTMSDWSNWGTCSKTCGDKARKTRTRTVANKAYFGGSCDETFEEFTTTGCAALCPVDCQWSAWSHFGDCSQSCRDTQGNNTAGTMFRYRYPAVSKQNGGKDCAGPQNMTISCGNNACAIDCDAGCDDTYVPCDGTTGWHHWGSCFGANGAVVTCGGGRRTRTREITVRPAFGGDTICPSKVDIDPNCADTECPKECVLSQWADWGPCTNGGVEIDCGGGERTRWREILVQPTGVHTCADLAGYGDDCDYAAGTCTETAACPEPWSGPCPVDCNVTGWSSPGPCSVSCGGGVQYRTRSIVAGSEPANGGKQCPSLVKEETCKTGAAWACPVDCLYSAWGDWESRTWSNGRNGTCSHECGNQGIMRRTRTIVRNPSGGVNAGSGLQCGNAASLIQTDTCNRVTCPVDCTYGSWGASDAEPVDADGWRACSKTCGWGTKKRYRAVATPESYGGMSCADKFGATVETAECNDQPCAVNCEVNPWEGWSNCSLPCVDGDGGAVGKMWRRRTILTHDAHGGASCSHANFSLYEETPCNTHQCAVDCVADGWPSGGTEGWSTCSSPCDASNGGNGGLIGGGLQTRSRGVFRDADHGGKECNRLHQPLWEQRECKQGAVLNGTVCDEADGCLCPIDCVLSDIWTDEVPGQCLKDGANVTCGTGQKRQIREVVQQKFGTGASCPSGDGVSWRDVACADVPCPVDCQVGAWDYSDWGSAPCERDGSTVTCGGGRQTRQRTLTEAQNGGVPCHRHAEGKYGAKQSKSCAHLPCAVNCQISQWGTTAAGATQPNTDANGWQTCSATCRQSNTDGTAQGPSPQQIRQRFVKSWGNQWGTPCCPSDDLDCLEEQQDCNTNEYCEVPATVSAWSEWGNCKDGTGTEITCSTGTKTRTRVQVRAERHGGPNVTAIYGTTWNVDTASCDMGACPVNCEVGCNVTLGSCFNNQDDVANAWHDWGSCLRDGAVVTCGGGRKTRTRDILTAPTHADFVCGLRIESTSCAPTACPVDCSLAPWGDWHPIASSPTGEAQVQRARKVRIDGANSGTTCKETCDQASESVTEDCTCTSEECTETKNWRSVAKYQTSCAALSGLTQEGSWSSCDKTCGTGHKYRYVVRAVCSERAVMKIHLKQRVGKTCNTGNCTAGQTGDVLTPITIPAVTIKTVFDDTIGPDSASAVGAPFDNDGTAATDANSNAVLQRPGSITLDEELSWRTMTAEEARFHGLPAGDYQVRV